MYAMKPAFLYCAQHSNRGVHKISFNCFIYIFIPSDTKLCDATPDVGDAKSASRSLTILRISPALTGLLPCTPQLPLQYKAQPGLRTTHPVTGHCADSVRHLAPADHTLIMSLALRPISHPISHNLQSSHMVAAT